MKNEDKEQVIEDAANDILKEYYWNIDHYGTFHSSHEGFAILLEEVNELWDEVKKRYILIDKAAMYKEAKHTAAMALKFMVMLKNEKI